MKQLLTGVAVVAALALRGPFRHSRLYPSGGNAMGTPGPNPGGPGLTPYSSGPHPAGVQYQFGNAAEPPPCTPSHGTRQGGVASS